LNDAKIVTLACNVAAIVAYCVFGSKETMMHHGVACHQKMATHLKPIPSCDCAKEASKKKNLKSIEKKKKKKKKKKSESKMDDQKLAMFQSMTGIEDSSIGIAFLDATDWNVERATNNYFDNGQPKRSKSSERHEKQKETVNNNNNNNNNDHDKDDNGDAGVRAPIAPTQGVLFDNGFGHGAGRLMPQNHFAAIGQSQFAMPSSLIVAGRQAPASVSRKRHVNVDERKAATLQTLFQPPYDIMFSGPYDAAKQEAVSRNRFLLVNIQDAASFSSHRLNRDVWSSRCQRVRDLVELHFIFWQAGKLTGDGPRFVALYHVADFPFVAIVDAVTGTIFSRYGGEPSGKQVGAWLEKFVGEHSLVAADNASPALLLPTASSVSLSAQSDADSIDLGEDEQFKLAIQASLNESADSSEFVAVDSQDDDSDDVWEVSTDDDENDDEKQTAATKKEKQDVKEPSTATSLQRVDTKKRSIERVSSPPAKRQAVAASGGRKCVLQVRQPNGTAMRGEFSEFDTLSTVVDWIQANRTDGSAAPFYIATQFPRRVFGDNSMHFTLADADLVPRTAIILQPRSID
jgi:UBX domain/UBA-like domain/Thioredoxin-like